MYTQYTLPAFVIVLTALAAFALGLYNYHTVQWRSMARAWRITLVSLLPAIGAFAPLYGYYVYFEPATDVRQFWVRLFIELLFLCFGSGQLYITHLERTNGD